ncbi:MAG: hypothetical protein ACFB22_08165 [Rhodothalassiaceae bacterium]
MTRRTSLVSEAAVRRHYLGWRLAVVLMGLVLAFGFGLVSATLLYRIQTAGSNLPDGAVWTPSDQQRLVAVRPAGTYLLLEFAGPGGKTMSIEADPRHNPAEWTYHRKD